MKWILVWWIISPGHPQVLHIERGFESEKACETYAGAIPVHNTAVRWHCSME
jgi:hypothetical protein